jgi:predicted esterase
MGLVGQTTGSFDSTITFNGENRTLSCFVPTDYDSSQDYQVLIGLHGLGDTGTNYRNAVINSDWDDIFAQTIFIFPDGGEDQNSDFYAPAGDEEIIVECINFAKDNYSVDTTAIILQGFSLGGSSAMRYGLKHPEKFKGLLLNTPAVQGVADAQNLAFAYQNVPFEYENAAEIPMFITVGESDVLYEYTLQGVYPILKKNNAYLKYEVIAGMGHSLPPNSITTEALDFIEAETGLDYDVDIFEINNSKRTCESDFTPQCYVRNTGAMDIAAIEFEYNLDGSNYNYTWTGNLSSFEHALVEFPVISLNSGSHDLEIEIESLNTVYTDSTTEDNFISFDFESGDSQYALPYFEDFEGDMSGWVFDNNFNIFEWYQDDETSKNGDNSISTFNSPFVFDTYNWTEAIQSPMFDLSNESNAKLSFNLAYNYLKYTPPYSVDSVLYFADTLEVQISTDCGDSFQTILRKGGAELATSEDPILNPLSITDCIFNPDQTEWDYYEIDLTPYIASSDIIFKFSYTSALGGSIYIDDFKVNTEPLNLVENKEEMLSLYPNPAVNYLKIEGFEEENATVTIYDVQGKMVLKTEISKNNNQIDIQYLSKGYYQVELISGNTKMTQKFIKSNN